MAQGTAVQRGECLSRQPVESKQPALSHPGADHPSNVVHYTPRWIGKQEESINITHISSVKIDTHLLFSNVLSETTGGANPIRCYGHQKRDAVKMKSLIEQHQHDYYRQSGGPASSVGKTAFDR
jgi:hypothetical protein